jgi:hypothetical protein
MPRLRGPAKVFFVELEIRPDPPEDVRRAIAAALEASREAERESAWWRAGVGETLADEDG